MKLKNKNLNGFEVYYRNEKEFNMISLEIFTLNDYKFTTNTKKPFIIDCGSHIGLSILYFKHLYPNAEILGFEPNPENFEILKKNIHKNKLKNVRVINAALSDRDGVAFLHAGSKSDDSLTWGDTISPLMVKQDGGKTSVATCRLSKFINKRVDFLKMDIEGMEGVVLKEIEPKLSFVRAMVMEHHVFKERDKQNNLKEIIDTLRRSSFIVKPSWKDLIIAFCNLFPLIAGQTLVSIVRGVR